MPNILVTGDAGFIGFHLSKALLDRGHHVLGIDGMTNYYDPALKFARLAELQRHDRFKHVTLMLEDVGQSSGMVEAFAPEIIVHLAAQAGVRYSLEAPDAYIASNVTGTLRLLELARTLSPAHLLVASTSSVYGGNVKMPFAETDVVQAPVSLYSATKLATEALSHSFSHLWGIPTTCFRFFTVYGPWGRPDMALFKFVESLRADRMIDVYGHGKMKRDFTYIDDLVAAIVDLVAVPPVAGQRVSENDSLSPVAPYRVVNIAGGKPTELLEFVSAIETATGRNARKNLLPMQAGDVVATWADTALLRELIGVIPDTPVADGVKAFVHWYDQYYAEFTDMKSI